MNIDKLKNVARAMVVPGKGILAMDESTDTCAKRFAEIGVECSEENRRAYRELLVTTPGIGKYISGAILFDETLRQKTDEGVSFVDILKKQGVIPGVKVDKGAKDMAGFPGEKITEGLDDLRERLKDYSSLGVEFAKWRAVITIGKNVPSYACVLSNAQALARYAALCQEQDIVPIVEPEVLMDGEHDIGTCFVITEWTLNIVFSELRKMGVALDGMVLKPNMVISGLLCKIQADLEKVTDMTVKCLFGTVPASVPGVAFLSGGQSDALATAHLNMMNKKYRESVPWRLTFSYGRGMQREALHTWKGNPAQFEAAQQALLKRAEENGMASEGLL